MYIETGCRLHFGLIDLNGNIGRVDGGIGLGLNKPGMEMKGNRAEDTEVSGHMSNKIAKSVLKVLEEIGGNPVHIEVKTTIPEHIGLGSGTQAALAGGKLAALLNDVELDTYELARITGRGGTSGIGTAAFDTGGFILDGGHDFDCKRQFTPSSVANVGPPPVLARYKFPNWKIAVFTPEGRGAHGQDELDIFKEACPIDSTEVANLSRIILLKLLPSIKSDNFGEFRRSIKAIQRIGFKREEIKRQPESSQIISKLTDAGYAAGLSSLGPVVFAIHPKGVDHDIVECPSFETTVDHYGAIVRE